MVRITCPERLSLDVRSSLVCFTAAAPARGEPGSACIGVGKTQLCFTCYVLLRPASYQSLQLAEPVRIIHPERGADPSCLYWPGGDETVTRVWIASSVYWYLPELQGSKAQRKGKQVLKYSGV